MESTPLSTTPGAVQHSPGKKNCRKLQQGIRGFKRNSNGPSNSSKGLAHKTKCKNANTQKKLKQSCVLPTPTHPSVHRATQPTSSAGHGVQLGGHVLRWYRDAHCPPGRRAPGEGRSVRKKITVPDRNTQGQWLTKNGHILGKQGERMISRKIMISGEKMIWVKRMISGFLGLSAHPPKNQKNTCFFGTLRL